MNWMLAAGLVVLGVLWGFSDGDALTRASGALFFAFLAVLALPGVRVQPPVVCLALGALALGMGASFLLVGGALIVVPVALAAGRAWHGFQDTIVKDSGAKQ